ncbi:hypothetical protein CI610_03556 [invertebrate metagenome]|uniref:Uncharacterized protein n=1 Tax=invertebrate metagenome TaxID=1711999 RepID=A0A2H9T2U7_9ZZZZ
MFYNQIHLKKGINGLMSLSDKSDRMEDRMLRTGCYCEIMYDVKERQKAG